MHSKVEEVMSITFSNKESKKWFVLFFFFISGVFLLCMISKFKFRVGEVKREAHCSESIS